MSRVVRRRRTDPGEGGSSARRQSAEEAARLTTPHTSLPEIPGKIKKVVARNFMCHEHLSVDFSSDVTFITGENGSGKSAVLTAVVVCLGGRASATERGSRLSDLIRKGEKWAVLEVTLTNKGSNAYKPDQYGDQITVERTIRENGGSYRLLNAKGKALSKKKVDLDYILDALRIQVDNPIAILTQEESKNFLRSEDPKVKYNLFMRATQLRQIENGYKEACHNLREARLSVEDKRQSLEYVNTQVERMKSEVDVIKNRNQMKGEVTLLENERNWLKVADLEETAKEQEKECRNCEEKTTKLTTSRTQLEQLLQDGERKKEELKKDKTEMLSAMDEEGRAAAERQKQLEALRKAHRNAETLRKKEEDRANNFRKEKESLEREIQRLYTESQPDYAAQEQAAQQREDQLRAEVEQLRAAELTRAAHAKHCAETVLQLEGELRQLHEEEQQRRRDEARLRDELERVSSSRTHPRNLFGRWVAAVDRDIEECWQQKRFRKKPIGPVGAHIKLRPGCEEWTPLVELGLASVLKAYLVDDQQDMHLMNSILQRHCSDEPQKPRVITSRFLGRVHDVSLHGVDTGGGQLVTLWSVLDIEHPVVANAVIDQTRAESVLLLRTDEQARHMMAYRQNVPPGCAQALTQTGYRYYPDPSYRTYPVNVRARAQFLQVSPQQSIARLQSELQLQRSQLQDVSLQVQQARDNLRPAVQQERAASQQLQQGRQQLSGRKRELQLVENRERAQPVNVSALEEEVRSYADSLQQSEQQLQQLQSREQEARQSREDAERRDSQAREQLRDRFPARLGQQIEEELAALELKKNERRHKLAQYDAKLGELRQMHEHLKEQLARTGLTCQEKTEEAAAAGERVALPSGLGSEGRVERAAKLERKLARLRRRLDEMQECPIDDDEAKTRYREAQRHQHEIEAEVHELNGTVQKLSTMLTEREHRVEQLKLSQESRVKHYFHINLDTRNLGGEIQFDHKKGTLSLTIQVDQQGASKSTLQLSGGERSFSTLAFVMAMWSAMYSPFRMLDEYDVFMDEVNRKISLDMLKEHALSTYNQYVFITPLNVGRQEQRVDVIRMRPPVRELDD